jgi:protein SCO1/2
MASMFTTMQHRPGARSRAVTRAGVAVFALWLASGACYARQQAASPMADPHAQHRMQGAATEPLMRSTAEYRLEDLWLLRSDGKRVALDNELNYNGPLVLNFVFTTCTAVCPILSRTFSELQTRSDPAKPLRLISISIDPQHDTPAVLLRYAKQFDAGKGWRFYTGTVAESVAVQRAFDVYRGNKMNHVPLTLLRRRLGEPWIRLEGYASVDALLRELAPAAHTMSSPSGQP